MWSYLTTDSFISPLPGYVENKPGFEVLAERTQQLAQHHSIRVFFRPCISVPAVQRIEQGFPKGKTAFLHKSAGVSSSGQMTIFQRVE
jgi:hypothetical protein